MIASDENRIARRRRLRLADYDYCSAGAYFVTIGTHGRACIFGDVDDGTMILNAAGQLAQDEWLHLPERFHHIQMDACVVMPNHIHGIIMIDTAEAAPHLGSIVGAFKSITSVLYARAAKRGDFMPLRGRLWQRNYYEHVIRSEQALNSIREYIANNPLQWSLDCENPNADAGITITGQRKEKWQV